MALGLNSALAAGTTVDLYNQFPDAQGQNGFNAFRYNAGRMTPFQFLTRESAYYFDTPGVNDYNIPLIRKLDSPWIAMHPSALVQGTIIEDAVLAWKVPQTATYFIKGQFAMQLPYGGGDVNVYIRTQTILWGPKNLSLVGSQPFHFKVNLPANEMLFFGVAAGQDDVCDTTLLTGQISTSGWPDPATSLLLLD